MEDSRQFRKRPQSEFKPISYRTPVYDHRYTRSTTRTAFDNSTDHSNRRISARESAAFIENNFLDNNKPGPSDNKALHSDASLPGLAEEGPPGDVKLPDEENPGLSERHKAPVMTEGNSQDTSSLASFPKHVETSKLSLEELLHPSGSPVLNRELVKSVEEPTSLARDHKLEGDYRITAKHTAKSRSNVIKDEVPTIQDSVLAALEKSNISVTKHVASLLPIKEQHLAPKVGATAKYNTAADMQSRTYPTLNQLDQVPSVGDDAHAFQIRRKSLPVTAQVLPESPTSTLKSTQEWLNDLANQGSKIGSNEWGTDTSEGVEDTLSATETEVPHLQSGSARSGVPRERPRSTPSEPRLAPGKKPIAKRFATTKELRNARPATPGPTARPASPPRHRNVAENRKSLEKQDRDSCTLYNTSCWTEKSYLKTLHEGSFLEFRVEPHGEPFLVKVSQEMLKHFCGEKHVDRLIRDYSLRPEQRKEEDGEGTILVFPEGLVDATAIMRIVRYMRRCCPRTTTLTKPHFQLDAPPSLEANIETIRACNIFGLYADAHRLQYFLTDKKIPGGRLTMEDVETIWEGYDGGLRDSAYTDALLTHIVYNVLGSDSVDREEIIVLLEQEEFAELRELLSMELGIKKRAAESREMFQMRKELEREDKVNQKNGKGKRLSKLEELRTSKGPMVQGRLLRVLSYDALFEPDLTANMRYKPKPRLGRRSASTPDLTDSNGEDESGPVGYLYQDALREIKGAGTAAERIEMMLKGLSNLEEETAVLSRHTSGRPAAPTPSGRKREISNLGERRVQDLEDIRPMVSRKAYQPSGTGMTRTGYSSADNTSGTEPSASQAKAIRNRTAAPIPDTRPYASVRPLHSQRTRVYAGSNASSAFGSNSGRRQPGSFIVNVSLAHLTAEITPALRFHTDPWWSTLGQSPPLARKKSRSKLKQIWSEVRNFL